MTNNLLNKNSLIGALIILLLVTSWWGQSKTGTSKQLAQDKKAAEEQLVSVEVEVAEARRARQESETALRDAEEKLRALEQDKHDLAKAFSDEQSAVATLKKEEKVLLEKINELEYALKQAKKEQEQTGSEQQQDLRQIAAERKETLTKLQEAQAKLRKAQEQITRLRQQQKKIKMQSDARIAQLKQQQDEASGEVEFLRAQVIGFEKVVEEKNADLAEAKSNLASCQVNTKVLLTKITEQENAQQGMEEQMRNIVQNLTNDPAQEKSPAPEQKEQAAHAE